MKSKSTFSFAESFLPNAWSYLLSPACSVHLEFTLLSFPICSVFLFLEKMQKLSLINVLNICGSFSFPYQTSLEQNFTTQRSMCLSIAFEIDSNNTIAIFPNPFPPPNPFLLHGVIGRFYFPVFFRREVRQSNI